jgi:PIN domain
MNTGASSPECSPNGGPALPPESCLSSESDLPTLESSTLQQRVDDAKLACVQLLRDADVEVLPYPAVSHAELLGRCIARRKPFDQDGCGYGDALIWYTVLELCKTRSEALAFLTNNVTDFFTKDHLHADLAGDLTQAELLSTKLVVYRSFYQFNDRRIKPVLLMLKDIEEQILQKTYAADLEHWLGSEGVYLFSSRSLAPIEFGAAADQPFGSVTRIVSVISFTPTDVRALDADQIVVLRNSSN